MTHPELAAAGYDVDAAGHALCARFVALLLTENRRLNLTAIRDEQEAWRAHVCDSLALLPLIRETQPRSLLDLGSGGGLPGVPVACACPHVQVTLLDATRKKLAAVERIVRDLPVENVVFACGRAETLAHDPGLRERFDAVTARAVAELRVLVEYGAGFVRPDGVCWFFKTQAGFADELAAAAQAARACALDYIGARTYRIPGADAERAIVVYRKQGPLAANLPRRTGRPQKRPL
jgi:16S rRNA (guanine527-N7)-methyltransferase